MPTLCEQLGRTHRTVQRAAQRFYPGGFGTSHVDVLIALADARQPIAAKVLAARSGVLPGALTGLVTTLQAHALLERQRSTGDRRSVTIRITPQGRRTARRLRRLRERFEQTVGQDLSVSAAAGVEASLCKLERGAAALEADLVAEAS